MIAVLAPLRHHLLEHRPQRLVNIGADLPDRLGLAAVAILELSMFDALGAACHLNPHIEDGLR